MANVFKLKTKNEIQHASAELLYSVPASKTAIVLGLVCANKGTSAVKATVTLINADGNNVTVLNAVTLPKNSTLEFFAGQKLVLNTTDQMKVQSDVALSLDVALSIMEQDV
jgi:hypothetical protein